MKLTLSPPIGKLLAVTILLCMVWLGWTLAVVPLTALPHARYEEILAMAERLRRLEAVIGRKAEVERRLAGARESLDARAGFWTATSAAASVAAVQEQIQALVQKNGGRLRATSVARESNQDGFRKFAMSFTIDGSLPMVRETLVALETSTPLLTVERVAIRTSQTPTDPRVPPQLNFELGVAGFVEPPAP